MAAIVIKDRRHLLWLVYLCFFLMGPVVYGDRDDVLLALVGVVLFLPLYYLGLRREGNAVLLPTAGVVLLGVLFSPVNPGASVFFIYAAAFVSRLESRRRVMLALFALAALVAIVTVTLQAHPFFYLPAIALIFVVGLATRHDREMAVAHRELERSQQEVASLARIAERERIARDLHDLLGHTLSVVVLKSELARKLAGRDPERAAREIADVEAVARQALGEMRGAVAAYRAETLAGELENARRALAAAGVELVEEIAPMSLPSLQEGVLALALREAVTNVVRHAGAKRCRVRLDAEAGDVRLEIEDDGRGFSGQEASEGSGLRGMRERVAGLGGMVERLASAGTRLSIRLPVTGLGQGELAPGIVAGAPG